MKKEEIANELMELANEQGLIVTLYRKFGKNISVSVPYSQKACDTNIDELDFSVRANNSMKRAGVFTVGEVIDLIENGGLLKIRNLGKKTQNEIKTRILAFGYLGLTKAEKKQFFCDLLNK